MLDCLIAQDPEIPIIVNKIYIHILVWAIYFTIVGITVSMATLIGNNINMANIIKAVCWILLTIYAKYNDSPDISTISSGNILGLYSLILVPFVPGIVFSDSHIKIRFGSLLLSLSIILAIVTYIFVNVLGLSECLHSNPRTIILLPAYWYFGKTT